MTRSSRIALEPKRKSLQTNQKKVIKDHPQKCGPPFAVARKAIRKHAQFSLFCPVFSKNTYNFPILLGLFRVMYSRPSS
jgi:hypothetical protein